MLWILQMAKKSNETASGELTHQDHSETECVNSGQPFSDMWWEEELEHLGTIRAIKGNQCEKNVLDVGRVTNTLRWSRRVTGYESQC